MDEVFIPLGETLLITHFKPLWNVAVDGFGNHAPGSGRSQGKKPAWDVIHPGRSWAGRLKAALSVSEVEETIQAHYRAVVIPPGDLPD